MCSNPCESELTCFRPESNREPYGLLNLLSAALSTTELWWRMTHRKSFRTLFLYYTGKSNYVVAQQADPRRQLPLPITRGFTHHQDMGRCRQWACEDWEKPWRGDGKRNTLVWWMQWTAGTYRHWPKGVCLGFGESFIVPWYVSHIRHIPAWRSARTSRRLIMMGEQTQDGGAAESERKKRNGEGTGKIVPRSGWQTYSVDQRSTLTHTLIEHSWVINTGS